MAMTAEVKDELSRIVINSVSARRAEVAALLRFAGGLHIVSGRVVVEAEVELGSIARRLRKDIQSISTRLPGLCLCLAGAAWLALSEQACTNAPGRVWSPALFLAERRGNVSGSGADRNTSEITVLPCEAPMKYGRVDKSMPIARASVLSMIRPDVPISVMARRCGSSSMYALSAWRA